jgi:hypothetical protein
MDRHETPRTTSRQHLATQFRQNANDIIHSFVGFFNGLFEQDKADVTTSLQNLVQVALSYAEQSERQSNFTQNILQTGADRAFVMLYYSTFEIYVSERKGVITYHSSYTLAQAQYALNQETWDVIKDGPVRIFVGEAVEQPVLIELA